MYTSCPQCGATFSITITQLGSGRGTVKCGNCHLFFNALLALQETKALESKPGSVAPIEASSIPELLQPSEQNDHPPEVIEPIAPWEKECTTTSFGKQLLWATTSLVALTLLTYQLYFYERELILSNTTIRPLLEQACQKINCKLPPLKMVSNIDVVNRSIAVEKNRLKLKITLANHSKKPQPFPLIKLTLSNLNGNAVAQRIFTANEYLTKVHSKRPMPIDTPIDIELMIIKPVHKIESFSFELL